MSDVFISIDTEFSAGGYFASKGQPVTDQAVYCRIGETSHGLGFMLKTFAEFGVKATFFVEAAHTALMGFDAMKPAVADIASAGHDIQLHLHPMWADKSRPVNDSMENLELSEALDLLDIGLTAFEKWGLKQPIAFRAGNLQMGRHVYDALARAGIPVSSSVGMAIHRPRDEQLHLQSGVHLVGKTIEVPVLTYQDLAFGNRNHLKNLTITGCSAAETRAVMRQAAKILDDIVVLTHPFEFIKRNDPSYCDITVNRVNQQRLTKLCAMLSTHDDFSWQTFSGKFPTWRAATIAPAAEIKAPFHLVIGRIIENQLNDRLAWF